MQPRVHRPVHGDPRLGTDRFDPHFVWRPILRSDSAEETRLPLPHHRPRLLHRQECYQRRTVPGQLLFHQRRYDTHRSTHFLLGRFRLLPGQVRRAAIFDPSRTNSFKDYFYLRGIKVCHASAKQRGQKVHKSFRLKRNCAIRAESTIFAYVTYTNVATRGTRDVDPMACDPGGFVPDFLSVHRFVALICIWESRWPNEGAVDKRRRRRLIS